MKDNDLRYVLRKIRIVGSDAHIEVGICDAEKYDVLCSKVGALYDYLGLSYREVEKHGEVVQKEEGGK